MRQVRIVDRNAVVLAAREFDFGREVRRPIGNPLPDHTVNRLGLRVPVGVSGQSGRTKVRIDRLCLLRARETDAGALAVADVPVEFRQIVLDQQVAGRRIEPADIDAVGVLGDRLRAGQRGRSNGDLAARGTADQAKVRRGA